MSESLRGTASAGVIHTQHGPGWVRLLAEVEAPWGCSGAKETGGSVFCCGLTQTCGGQVASTGARMTKFNPALAAVLRQGRVYF